MQFFYLLLINEKYFENFFSKFFNLIFLNFTSFTKRQYTPIFFISNFEIMFTKQINLFFVFRCLLGQEGCYEVLKI